jgi:hypothetical protein
MHFMFNNFFFENCLLVKLYEKYSTIGLATDGNMAHVLCMLDVQGYKTTLRICNTYCFFTTTVFP